MGASVMNLSLSKIFLVLIFTSCNSYAYFIDYLKIQHAGEIGTYALGIGKNFTENYSVDFLHGRVPHDIGGEEIDTYAIKNNYKFFDFE